MTGGSLFSGCGGFDLGMHRAGIDIRWQVEISEYRRKVLAKHWPNTRRWDDVRTWPQPDTERVAVIFGGDPCQGNSNAGSVWKKQHEDYGSELLRIVNALRPRIVVRENPYPSRPDAIWPWWRMRNELERLGYAVLPFRLRSCCTGACHKRDRVFLLAELPNANSVANAGEGCSANACQAKEVPGEVRQQRIRADAGSVGGVDTVPPDRQHLYHFVDDRLVRKPQPLRIGQRKAFIIEDRTLEGNIITPSYWHNDVFGPTIMVTGAEFYHVEASQLREPQEVEAPF